MFILLYGECIIRKGYKINSWVNLKKVLYFAEINLVDHSCVILREERDTFWYNQ